MTNLEILQQFINNGGNCINLGRTIKSKNPELHKWISDSTSFLSENCKFSERIYCVIHNIGEAQLNYDGTLSNFINLSKGYARKVKPKQVKIKKDRPPRFTKLQHFITRNKRLNKELYEENMIEGEDYVVCPVSNCRMLLIRKKYIEKVLEMPYEQYILLYPDINMTSDALYTRIIAGVQKYDETLGMTKHQYSVIQSKVTLPTPDENGITGYNKLGEKTKRSHLLNIDEYGRNGYQQQAYNRVTTILPSGRTVEQESHSKRLDTINSMGAPLFKIRASAISIKILNPIITYLTDNNIYYLFNTEEFSIKDDINNRYYYYDLTIPDYDIIIEYQSNAWHVNPAWDTEKWDNWTPPKGEIKLAQDVLNYDYHKAKYVYDELKLVTYYAWEDTQIKDVEQILCLLKTLTMKS